MVTVGFSDSLVSLVLSGEKTTTWRLWDDKDLKDGDEVMFVEGSDRKPFAKAKLLHVVEKKFGEINEDDWKGHEQYDDIYKTYSDFYKRAVMADTPIKIVKYELLEKYR